MVAIMYVSRVAKNVGERRYEQVLLRESYRPKGAPRSQVKHRTLLNLTHGDPTEVAVIEWALKHKHALPGLPQGSGFEGVELVQGPSVGAVWLLYQVAQRVGLVKALGTSPEGVRTLWQVFARPIDQGSRLSAVRLAGEHAACAVLGLEPFDEEALYRDGRAGRASGADRGGAVSASAGVEAEPVVSLRRDQQLSGGALQRIRGVRVRPRP